VKLSPLPLPSIVQHRLDAMAQALLQANFDFTTPPGEEALVPADSVSWRVFKNPLSVFVGGVAAVLLELAEPRVRTGVWEHTSFRSDPVKRMQRTGLAAMITVYGPSRAAEQMIAGVVNAHARIAGTTPDGRSYRANDPELLTWVHATASFGFAESYSRYVRALSRQERDCFYREGDRPARLYGVVNAPRSDNERRDLFVRMAPQLQASTIIQDFLTILHDAPAFPAPLRGLQRLLIRAAVELVPHDLRENLRLSQAGLRAWELPVVRSLCAGADHVLLNTSPAVQSCRRLGLPPDYLYRSTISSLANVVTRS
jgi:uncharacterized protein (DUF2236 family)